jgi:hypothetical protein
MSYAFRQGLPKNLTTTIDKRALWGRDIAELGQGQEPAAFGHDAGHGGVWVNEQEISLNNQVSNCITGREHSNQKQDK